MVSTTMLGIASPRNWTKSSRIPGVTQPTTWSHSPGLHTRSFGSASSAWGVVSTETNRCFTSLRSKSGEVTRIEGTTIDVLEDLDYPDTLRITIDSEEAFDAAIGDLEGEGPGDAVVSFETIPVVEKYLGETALMPGSVLDDERLFEEIVVP